MSIAAQIISALERASQATVDDLAVSLPQYTRKQIASNLHWLSFVGRVRRIKRGRGRGFGGGSELAVYGPCERREAQHRIYAPAVNSVWQLGSRA